MADAQRKEKGTVKKPLVLTEENFEEHVLRADGKPVLVDFWAPWCGPCRVMGPILDQLAKDLDGRAVIAKVNVDEEPALANLARVRAIPTLLLLHGGEVRDVLVGVQDKKTLRSRIEEYVSAPRWSTGAHPVASEAPRDSRTPNSGAR